MSECCSVNRSGIEISNKDLDVSIKKDVNQETSRVWIPSGTYRVGSHLDMGYPNDFEYPEIEVTTDGFYMDVTTVTNQMFEQFVQETGYVTFAESYGSSFVFHLLLETESKGVNVTNLEWWVDTQGANWKYPFGDARTYQSILDHPVVHVTMQDALAYCFWANKRLPTEIEWEIAARGGKEKELYPWGEELVPNGVHQCNIWQGEFPKVNSIEDGYLGTAPAHVFYKNSYGVKQMVGNVWELCSNQARIPLNQIKKMSMIEQMEQFKHNQFLHYAAKGGSFLCHQSYCNRYRLAARNGIDRYSSSSNCGFRCVQDF